MVYPEALKAIAATHRSDASINPVNISTANTKEEVTQFQLNELNNAVAHLYDVIADLQEQLIKLKK